SLAPLHLAAWRGLDDVVERLLSCGASVDVFAGAPYGKLTFLLLAIVKGNISTATLLLANGASPNLLHEDNPFSTTLHLVCILGHTDLVKPLMATASVQADPSKLLECYAWWGVSDEPAILKLLVEEGAGFYNGLVDRLRSRQKYQSLLALLHTKEYRNTITSQGQGPAIARQFLRSVNLSELDTEIADQIIRQLFDLSIDTDLCADPDFTLEPLLSPLDFPDMLKLLPIFLERGMDVNRGTNIRTGYLSGEDLPDSYPGGSLLYQASTYTKYRYKEDSAAQLGVVRLLLQHGAHIDAQTKGNCL
ncbi:ankyrin repeat-containing domain protein, partial [Lasiosphaeria ovina]